MKITSKESTFIVSGLFCLTLYFLLTIQDFETLVKTKGTINQIEESYNSMNLNVQFSNGQTSTFKVSISKTDILHEIEMLQGKEVSIWYSEEYELAYGVLELWQLSYKNRIIVNYKDMVHKTKIIKIAILFVAISFFVIVLLSLLFRNL